MTRREGAEPSETRMGSQKNKHTELMHMYSVYRAIASECVQNTEQYNHVCVISTVLGPTLHAPHMQIQWLQVVIQSQLTHIKIKRTRGRTVTNFLYVDKDTNTKLLSHCR